MSKLIGTTLKLTNEKSTDVEGIIYNVVGKTDYAVVLAKGTTIESISLADDGIGLGDLVAGSRVDLGYSQPGEYVVVNVMAAPKAAARSKPTGQGCLIERHGPNV